MKEVAIGFAEKEFSTRETSTKRKKEAIEPWKHLCETIFSREEISRVFDGPCNFGIHCREHKQTSVNFFGIDFDSHEAFQTMYPKFSESSMTVKPKGERK